MEEGCALGWGEGYYLKLPSLRLVSPLKDATSRAPKMVDEVGRDARELLSHLERLLWSLDGSLRGGVGTGC